MTVARHRWVLTSSLLALAACDGPAAVGDAGPADGGAMDASPTDAGTDARAPDPGVCDELGLVRAPMQDASGAAFDEVAGDFTVETLDGPWTLSEHWSGCDSYVFINYAANEYGDGLFETFPDGLYVNGPRNVHYFFASYETSPEAIRARMQAIVDGLQEGFDIYEISEADQAFWRSRLHFVVEPLMEVEGSVGELVRTQPIVHHSFAIMRDQKLDPVGSLFRTGSSGFVPDMGMAAYAGHYYNYLAALRERLADEDATVVSLIDEPDVTARSFDRTVTLPDADTMAIFDTMEIDVEVHCRQTPDLCSEWDRKAYVQLCEDETCASPLEIGRWITPYSRPGRMRWVWDASPFLALLRDGGSRTFRIITGPEWEMPRTTYDLRASLRLSVRGTPRAFAGERVFTGGLFDATYNDGRDPVAFTPPEGTAKVELVVIVSGHGQGGESNCAEWCNHEHTFTLNDSETYRIDFPGEAGAPLGCANRVVEGVVPGQWGNWTPGRAAWCPGLPVHLRRFDLTDAIDIDGANSLTYLGSYMGGQPPGGENVAIDLSAYLVYSR